MCERSEGMKELNIRGKGIYYIRAEGSLSLLFVSCHESLGLTAKREATIHGSEK
jgi:hypothetical protein